MYVINTKVQDKKTTHFSSYLWGKMSELFPHKQIAV